MVVSYRFVRQKEDWRVLLRSENSFDDATQDVRQTHGTRQRHQVRLQQRKLLTLALSFEAVTSSGQGEDLPGLIEFIGMIVMMLTLMPVFFHEVCFLSRKLRQFFKVMT